MRNQTLTIALAGLLSLAVSGTAAAQETSEDRAASLGREGLSLFDQGRWLEANSKFEQAQKLARSPVFDLYSARALRNAGRLLEAEAAFRRVIEESLGDKAPEAFAKAKLDAKRDHAQLVQRIPKVRIRPSRSLESGSEVSLDGQTVNAAVAILVDPGTHTIIIREGGKEVVRKQVDVRDGGGLVDVDVALPGTRNPSPPSAETPTAPPPATAEAASSGGGSLLPGALVLGGGVASLIVGAVTGGLALSQKNELETTCGGTVCPESAREDLDSANRLAMASTATFIIGGVLAAGGVTLMILRPGGSSDAPASTSFTLKASPTWLSLSGTF